MAGRATPGPARVPGPGRLREPVAGRGADGLRRGGRGAAGQRLYGPLRTPALRHPRVLGTGVGGADAGCGFRLLLVSPYVAPDEPGLGRARAAPPERALQPVGGAASGAGA